MRPVVWYKQIISVIIMNPPVVKKKKEPAGIWGAGASSAMGT